MRVQYGLGAGMAIVGLAFGFQSVQSEPAQPSEPVIEHVEFEADEWANAPDGSGVWKVRDIQVDFRPAVSQPASFDAAAFMPTSPSGDNQGACALACCKFLTPPCGSAPGVYPVGSELVLNNYWTEVLPPDPVGEWQALVTIGIKPPGGGLIKLADNAQISFGDLTGFGGLQINFCASFCVTIPGGAAGIQNVQHGFLVKTLGGQIPGNIVNSFSVLP